MEPAVKIFGAALLLLVTNVHAHVHANNNIVAFNAVRTRDFGPVSSDTIIPFDIVTLNMGGAYDPATGLFTAPLDGIYEIFWSVRSSEAVWCHLRVDNRDEGQLGTGAGETVSGSRILELKKGEQVGAQLYYYRGTYGKNLYCNGHRACAFSGHLLHVLF